MRSVKFNFRAKDAEQLRKDIDELFELIKVTDDTLRQIVRDIDDSMRSTEIVAIKLRSDHLIESIQDLTENIEQAE